MKKLISHNQTMASFFDSLLVDAERSELEKYTDLDLAETTLRKFLSLAEMREIGSFFTGKNLARVAIDSLPSKITDESVVLDPSCGTGNLLIEASRRLKIQNSLAATLKTWGRKLRGFDLQETFVEASKLRLILEAVDRGAKQDCTLDQALSYLNAICVHDALEATAENLVGVTHVLMNPPFSNWDRPKSLHWGQGKVNAAGIIFEHYIRLLPTGCELAAILPDVLRSGSRYAKWRTYVTSRVNGAAEMYGRFNSKTDIDVFVISGTISEIPLKGIRWFPETVEGQVLSEKFEICIGPVVDYRDPHSGVSAPFIHPRNTEPWTIKTDLNEFRQFKGRLIASPFVVIRRTSSPTDRYRVVAAVIDSKKHVAVENHLIVVRPYNGSLDACKELMEILRSPATQAYVNERIRCRHLTVGVIKNIPF